MNDNLPSYDERMDAIMARLRDALDPRDVEEQALVDWFRRALDMERLTQLASMVERAGRESWPV